MAVNGRGGEGGHPWRFQDFIHKNDTCYFCNGFYGPSFGEPVCGTCHVFLFPEDINSPEERVQFLEKTDDGDSGNEEPTDYFSSTKSYKPKMVVNNNKVDKLTEKITALTCPRDKDRVPEGLVDLLPPEVLLVVFSYLDDISLWNVTQVCKRWRRLLEAEPIQDQWQKFTLQRWPLFRPLYTVRCWRTVYTKLLESAPCKLCLQQMSVQVQPPVDLSGRELLATDSWRRNRIRTELKSLRSDPPDGIEATPLDRFCCHWQASITGPVGSPYEGGNFYLYLQIPHSYPMRPPVVRFITRIFHPNISRHGDIGIDSIHHNWSLALTISKVLISIQSLLTDPYCQVCMEPEIGKLFLYNRKLYNENARLWTWNYAMHDGLMPSKTMDQFWKDLQ